MEFLLMWCYLFILMTVVWVTGWLFLKHFWSGTENSVSKLLFFFKSHISEYSESHICWLIRMGGAAEVGPMVHREGEIQGGLASEHLSGDRPYVGRTDLLWGGIPVNWNSTLGMTGNNQSKARCTLPASTLLSMFITHESWQTEGERQGNEMIFRVLQDHRLVEDSRRHSFYPPLGDVWHGDVERDDRTWVTCFQVIVSPRSLS